MKKTTVKRIITTILAVATVGSTAALFAGCGEKSPEEKAKDAISDMYNKYKNAADESSEEEEKETVELNLLDKIVSDKLYTVKFIREESGSEGFYIRLNDAIDIDGYTVELQNKKDEFDPNSYQDWDIKKDGEKLASFRMYRDTWATSKIDNNKIAVSISAYDPPSEENSEVKFKFTETSRDDIEVDVPAALTQDECKQHMDELKAAAWDEFKDKLTAIDNNGKDHAHPKLDGVYYFYGNYDEYLFTDSDDNAERTALVFEFSLNIDKDVIHFGPDNFRGVMSHPFILDGKVNFCTTKSTQLGFQEETMSKGTKIG